MARVAVGWGVRELATAADVSPNTIARLERGDPLKESTVVAIRTALESAGVEFIAENGGGAGVRLRKALPGQTQPRENSSLPLTRVNGTDSEAKPDGR